MRTDQTIAREFRTTPGTLRFQLVSLLLRHENRWISLRDLRRELYGRRAQGRDNNAVRMVVLGIAMAIEANGLNRSIVEKGYGDKREIMLTDGVVEAPNARQSHRAAA